MLSGGFLGGYQILTRLSVGGMAEIFLAIAPANPGELRRIVTVKRILPDLREREEFVQMFLDEARISAALSHPNIAQVYELRHEKDELFIAMEFVAGQSLANIHRRCQKLKRPVPTGFAAMVGRDVGLALAAAHEFRAADGSPAPVIHRDVSPSNVMVTYDGFTKVIDFGVAKARGSLSRTSTGNVKGSRGYMSPEQARGAPLDPRSDLFSAGTVIHELLTGKPLFLRDSELATFRGILRDDIPTAISMNPGVPPALSEVLALALQRKVEARIPSARDFARMIAEAVPSLLHDQDEATQFMRSLFAQEIEETRTLLNQRSAKDSLEPAAHRLRQFGVPRNQGTDVFGPLPTGVMRAAPNSLTPQAPAPLPTGVTKIPDDFYPPPPPPPPEREEPRELVLEGATVLAVDDSDISRDFIEAHLEGSGFPMLHASSAEQAMKLIAERVPDLILLDVVMPGIDGFALCRMLREKCAVSRPYLPILFLSSSATFEQRLEGLAAGGDDFIAKPYQPEELIALVRAHLSRAAFLEEQRFKARSKSSVTHPAQG